MASESFSYMTSMYPGINTFTGIQNEMLGSGANHHTPQFDIDEAALPQGVAAALAYTLNFLENPPDTSGFQPLCGSLKELVDMLHQE
jgi:metal-dependent amidase/aminoacylase/carboxypeptidase family protein